MMIQNFNCFLFLRNTFEMRIIPFGKYSFKHFNYINMTFAFDGIERFFISIDDGIDICPSDVHP